MIANYAQVGMNVQEMYKKTITFCGEERDALFFWCDVNGAPYYALQLFDYNLGAYSVTLTLSSFVEDKTEDLIAFFSKYE